MQGDEKLLNLLVQPAELDIQHRFPGVEHHIYRPGQLPKTALHRSTHASPDTVTFHRASQQLAYSKTDTWTSLVVAVAKKQCKVSRKLLAAPLVNGLKISVLEQP